jgi:hypothetical protein
MTDRTAVFVAALMPALLSTNPAHSQVYSWSPCPIAGSCTIVQRYDVGYEALDSDNPAGDAKFAPIPIDPRVYGYIVGQRHTPSEPDWIVWSSVPFDTIINTPVAITDTSSGTSTTFNMVVTSLAVAALVAEAFDAPFAGEVGGALTLFEAFTTFAGPLSDAAYAGVHDMVQSIIDRGVGEMVPGGPPLGPDPLFDYTFSIEATTVSGSFEAYGDINSINNIHDVSLFVDGVAVNPSSSVPEPSTWAMLLIGLIGLWLGGRRRRHARIS